MFQKNIVLKVLIVKKAGNLNYRLQNIYLLTVKHLE